MGFTTENLKIYVQIKYFKYKQNKTMTHNNMTLFIIQSEKQPFFNYTKR